MTFLQFIACLRAHPDTPKGQQISRRQRERIATAAEITVVLLGVPMGLLFALLFP